MAGKAKTTKKTSPSLLICVDGKPYSKVAVHYACVKAKQFGYGVELLYVVDASEFNTLFSGDVMRSDRHKEAEKILKQLVAEAKEQYKLDVDSLIREGDIADEIMNEVSEHGSIAMLIFGATPDQKGSAKSGILPVVAGEIGGKVHVPVLIVPGSLSDEQIDELP